MTEYEQKRDIRALKEVMTYVNPYTPEIESLALYNDFIRMSDFGYHEGKQAAFRKVVDLIEKESKGYGTQPDSFRMFKNWIKLNKEKLIGAQ